MRLGVIVGSSVPRSDRTGSGFRLCGVIEKEHWGRPATKGLLMIIGLGAVSLCVGAIWASVLKPIYQLATEIVPFPGDPSAKGVGKFLVFKGFALMGVSIGWSWFNRWAESRLNWRLVSKVREAKEQSALTQKPCG